MAALLQFKLSIALWLGVSSILSAYSLSFMQQVRLAELGLVASRTAQALDGIAEACIATGAELAFRPPLPSGWFALIMGSELTLTSPYGSYSVRMAHSYPRAELRPGEVYAVSAQGDGLAIRRWT